MTYLPGCHHMLSHAVKIIDGKIPNKPFLVSLGSPVSIRGITSVHESNASKILGRIPLFSGLELVGN